MTVDTNIPLSARTVDVAGPLRNFSNDLRRNELLQIKQQEHQQLQELRDMQIINERYKNLDAREQSRLDNVTLMAQELQPLLEAGETDIVMDRLERRRDNLRRQAADGFTVDTTETDRAIELLKSGELDRLNNVFKSQVSLGRALEIIENPASSGIGGATGELINRLIEEGSANNVQDALRQIRGGAGATGRNLANIATGRQASFETEGGKQDAQVLAVADKEQERAESKGEAEVSCGS